MCGVAGFVTLDAPGSGLMGVLKSMTNCLSHRGPDDAGYVVLPYGGRKGAFVALGHRRLKIIDLSDRAHQPMTDHSGDLVISYNGEIYNYVELREELKEKGYDFISGGDTEVALKAYKEWGTGCFSKFNGMWALAIYDKKKEKIVLSRGRFGQKPLYYYKTDKEFIFASEIKALLKNPNVVRKPNYRKIFRYVAGHYRYVDIDNESFFENIFQVPKAGFMELDKSLSLKGSCYWHLRTEPVREGAGDDSVVKEFRDIFVDAVRLRLRSDVPVGCMLSGGMDSTSITSVAHKILNKPIVTFSGITREGRGVYDESDYIESVIKSTGARSHYVKPDPLDVFDTVNEMLCYHDEPICTITWYNLYLIAKKVRGEGVPVILNGHGGDELLAGYWDHYHYYFHDLETKGDIGELDRERKKWAENHGRDLAELEREGDYIRKFTRNEISAMSRYPDYSECFTDDFKKDYRENIRLQAPQAPLLTERLYLELLFETIPASLRPEDRNTMSMSLESRSPFLDYRLVEYCFSVPSRFKIRNGLGKWVLREAMKGILPENVRCRKDKAGFIAPAGEWFRTINREDIRELINSGSFKKRGIFDVDHINTTFNEHLSGKKDHQMFLWKIINIELWFKRFFNESGDEKEELAYAKDTV